MQVLNPSPAAAYTGVLRSTYKMASGEGILSLWRGMSSVVVGAGWCSPCHARAVIEADMVPQDLRTPSTSLHTNPSSTPWAAMKLASTILSLLVSLAPPFYKKHPRQRSCNG